MQGGAVLAGLGALVLVAMCSKQPAKVAAVDNVASASPAPTFDDRATVTAARVACRARPAAKARVVVRLSRGAKLDVLARSEGWAKVSPTGDDCWVATAQLDNVAPVASSTATYDPPSRPVALYSTPARRTTTRRARSSRSRSYYGGGSCPCGSGSICIGPRGGRYCITSGGNKRYGQ